MGDTQQVSSGAQRQPALDRGIVDHTSERTKWIGYLQMAGAICILVSTCVIWIRPGMPRNEVIVPLFVCVLALLAGIALNQLAHGDKRVYIPLSGRIDTNVIERQEVMVIACFVMVIIDLGLCSFLVAISGGIESIFFPLLLAVPAVAATLRLSHRMVFAILFIALFFALTGLFISGHTGYEILQSNTKDWYYKGALFLNTAVTLVLPLVGAIESLRKPAPASVLPTAIMALKPAPISDEDVSNCKIGLDSFFDEVGWGVGRLSLGNVHGEETLAEQSIILMFPYVSREDAHVICPRIAYITCIAHWFDDFFDAGKLSHLSDSDPPFDPRKLTIGKLCSVSLHLRRLRRKARSQAPRKNRWLVDRALLRIAIGGLVQHAKFEKTIEQYLERTRELAVQESPGRCNVELEKLYGPLYLSQGQRRLILWGTAKNVMELFDSLVEPSDPVCSELYSIFYTPFLLFQNLLAESQDPEEKFSEEFQRSVLNVGACLEKGSTAEAQLVTQLLPCLDVLDSPVFNARLRGQGSETLKGRRNQVESLLHLYGSVLPDVIRDRYEALHKRDDLWIV